MIGSWFLKQIHKAWQSLAQHVGPNLLLLVAHSGNKFAELQNIILLSKHDFLIIHYHRGVLPFDQRKKLLEKARARARRNRTTFTSCIVRGVQVIQFYKHLLIESWSKNQITKGSWTLECDFALKITCKFLWLLCMIFKTYLILLSVEIFIS